MPKVFLSYSRSDTPFVEELHRRLMRDGVDCFYDQESIAWGSNWVLELEKGLDECDSIVFVLTNEFISSKWAELERTSVIADDPDGARKKVRPLFRGACELPRFLKSIQSIDVSTDEKFEQAYPKICAELDGTLREDELSKDRTMLPPVVQLPRRHRMPYRSLGGDFAGRIEALWGLHDLLLQSDTAVVEGIGVVMGAGGLGKSQLATEYVHRFSGHYSGGVFWCDADQGLPVVISQIGEAANVAIDGLLPVEQQCEQLWRELSQLPSNVLIVFDNFPEEIALGPWLPIGANIRSLVTTRRRDLTRYPRVSLNYLSDDEGLELLNSGERKFGPEAIAVVRGLGGLPLALELARNFLNLRPTLSIEALLEEMATLGDMEVLQVFETHYVDELPTGHVKEVSATFQLSWNLASAEAQKMLKLIALLAPTAVPRCLIHRALDDEAGSRLSDPVDESIAELARLSLVDLDEEYDPQLHRLLAGFVATKIDDDDELRRLAVNVVSDELSRVTDEHDTQAYSDLEKMVSHGVHFLESRFIDAEQAISIAGYIGWLHEEHGRYRLGEQYRRAALASAEQSFEAGHPTIATRQSNLALVLQDLGELEAARDLLRAALASDEQSFEAGHPTIATRQSNLALVLQDLGELEAARDLLRAALASAEQSFEAGHPTIATRQSNLALVLQELGELEAARDLLSAAHASLESKFGIEHPSTRVVKGNLDQLLTAINETAK